MVRVLLGSALASTLLALPRPAHAQTEPPPPTTHSSSTPAGVPTAAPSPVLAPPPAAQPPAPSQVEPQRTPSSSYQAAPQTAYPNPPPPTAQNTAYPSAPPPSYQAAQPNAYPNPAPPSYQTPPPSGQGAYQGDRHVGQSGVIEPPAPPPAEDDSNRGFEFPDMSVRVDPLNWIIYGRLGLELEAAVWKFISVEVVPVFVTDSQPPIMNYGSFPGNLYQESNGLGSMSGASVGAGFWLNKKPFSGTVLRLEYTNYGYHYVSKTEGGAVVDEATHTDRRIVGFIGSHSKWGPFTIASGIGLGWELNRERRCITASGASSTNCSKEVFELAAQGGDVFQLYGWLHPAYLTFRLSLGFVF